MCAGLFLNGNPHKLNFGKIGQRRPQKEKKKSGKTFCQNRGEEWGSWGRHTIMGGQLKRQGEGLKGNLKKEPQRMSTQTQPQERVCYFFDLLKASLPHQSNQEQNMPVQGNKRGRRGKERKGETGKQRGRGKEKIHTKKP